MDPLERTDDDDEEQKTAEAAATTTVFEKCNKVYFKQRKWC
jgi:hypothetical protein